MTQQIINVGTLPNSGDGDPLRTAFQKTNQNFTELYQQSGATGKFVVPTKISDPITASSTPGEIYYNSVTGKFRGYNGITLQWENLN
jgi:hypothetical protein